MKTSDLIDSNTLTLLTLLINVFALPFIGYFIRKLEKNTNSIKDALVAASRHLGNTEGRAEVIRELQKAGLVSKDELHEAAVKTK